MHESHDGLFGQPNGDSAKEDHAHDGTDDFGALPPVCEVLVGFSHGHL